LLEPEADVPSVVSRVSGVCRALGAAGLDVSTALVRVPVPPPASVDEAQAATANVLATRPRPTAILCFNDMTAVGVIRGLRAAGVTVPGQMSVVGYDDVVFASELSPPLTTIRQPTYRLGWAAAELLLSERHPGHRHREVRFIPELVVRGSTAVAP
jgi:LacI family transcriptional regulator